MLHLNRKNTPLPLMQTVEQTVEVKALQVHKKLPTITMLNCKKIRL